MPTFAEDAKRFLRPLKDFPGETLRDAIDAIWAVALGYANLFLVTHIMQSFEKNDRAGFFRWITVFSCGVIVYWIIRVSLRKWGFVEFRHRVMKKLCHDYGKELFFFENSAFERMGTAKTAHTFDHGITVWTRLLHSLVRNSASSLVTVVVMIFVVAKAEPNLLFAFVFFAAVSLALYRLISKRTIIAKRERKDLLRETERHIVRMAMSKFEILQTGRIDQELQRLSDNNLRLETLAEPMERWARIGFAIPSVAVDFLRIGLYVTVGVGVFEHTRSVSGLVSAVALVGMLERNLVTLTDTLDQFQQEFIFVRSLWETFDNAPRITSYDTGDTFVPKKGEIVLKDVSYRYAESSPYVFRNFSLTIPGGKKIALVGASGGGKSTLMKLISGYFSAESGTILVDGQDLSAVAKKSYYAHIGYLTQDPSVFDGSVLENLISGAGRSVSDEEINVAIERTGCEFVWKLPEGLETQVWERGVRLSGGQKQRLAIAKVFLKDPEIVFLDEPTSALDSFSEETVSRSLDALFDGRTVVIVAHRLQTVKEADEIFVLEGGKIAEKGTHSELLAKQGTYFRMVELQSGF